LELESALALSVDSYRGRPKGGGFSGNGDFSDVNSELSSPERIHLGSKRGRRRTGEKRCGNGSGTPTCRRDFRESVPQGETREIKIRGARLFLLRCIRDI